MSAYLKPLFVSFTYIPLAKENHMAESSINETKMYNSIAWTKWRIINHSQ